MPIKNRRQYLSAVLSTGGLAPRAASRRSTTCVSRWCRSGRTTSASSRSWPATATARWWRAQAWTARNQTRNTGSCLTSLSEACSCCLSGAHTSWKLWVRLGDWPVVGGEKLLLIRRCFVGWDYLYLFFFFFLSIPGSWSTPRINSATKTVQEQQRNMNGPRGIITPVKRSLLWWRSSLWSRGYR